MSATPQPHTPTRSFLSLARDGKNGFWRYLATIFLIITFALIANTAAVLTLILAGGGEVDIANLSSLQLFLLAMSSFPAGLLALWIGVRFLHGRSFRTLLTAQPAFCWRRLLLSAVLWLALSALGDLVMALVFMPGNYAWSFNLASFLPFAILSLLLIPIQSSTEELIFRSYLMQGFGLLNRRPWLPLGISSIAFALLHIANPEVMSYGLGTMMAFYLSMGLLLGWVTLRSGGLEAALGLHAANNLYAALFVTFPGSALPSPALFTMLAYDPILSLGIFFAMAVLYLILFQWLERGTETG